MGASTPTLLTPPGPAYARAFCIFLHRTITFLTVDCINFSIRQKRLLNFDETNDRKSMSSAAAVTDSSFEQEVLQSDVPVLVDFWAPWCGPCRMVAPIVEEISKEFEGKVKVLKLNTDENPNVASQYGIRSIPTLMVFKGGQKVDTVVGAVPKATLAGTISKYL